MSGSGISRRSWLYASATLAAAACARRVEPTQLPAAGPEAARPLSRLGAENLLVLTELAAAVRRLHPSDQAVAARWEQLMLAGIRAVEGAEERATLAEGLRGLFARVAPTVGIWVSAAEDEQARSALAGPACADPDTEGEGEGEQEAEQEARAREPGEGPAKTRKGGHKQLKARTSRGAESAKDEADAGSGTQGDADGAGNDDAGASDEDKDEETGEKSADASPSSEDEDGEGETREGAPEEDDEGPESEADSAKEAKDGEGKEQAAEGENEKEGEEAKGGEDAKSGGEGEEAKSGGEDEKEGEDAKSGGEGEEAKSGGEGEDAKSGEKTSKDEDELEPRPPLHEALLDDREGLALVQWHRRGFFEGQADEGTPAGCARRIRWNPAARGACTQTEPARGSEPCDRCAGESFEALTPGDPAQLELGRGLSCLIPTALWSEGGQTLPIEAGGSEAPGPAVFDARAALDFSLADRATRLLVVLRCYALLRGYGPHADAKALREALIPALCRAAEHGEPDELAAAVETLLAASEDGNAAAITHLDDRRSRRVAARWCPPVGLGWVEERVVVGPLPGEGELPEGLLAGDELVRVDGEAIAGLIGEGMARTPAARPGVRVERALGGLLERGSEGAKLRIEVLRRVDEGEATLSVELRTDLHASERPDGLDLRPLEPFVELGEGVFYVDATRLGNLKAAARRLQRRRVGMTIVDLRGELADEGGSLLAHYLDAAEILAVERVPAGPDRSGALPLSAAGERSRAAERPWLPGKLAVLIDGRTRGRAEAEALGFGQLERACLVGSASAGELAGSAQTWLPGGWRLRFSTTELRSPEGEALWARGVEPKLRARPGVDGLRRGADEVLEVAISAGLGITDDRVKRPSWGRIR